MMTKGAVVGGAVLAVTAVVVGDAAHRSRHAALRQVAADRVRRDCRSLGSRTLDREGLLRELVGHQRWLAQSDGGALPVNVDAWCYARVEKDLGLRSDVPGVGSPPANDLPLPGALVGARRSEILAALGEATCGDWSQVDKRFVTKPCADSPRLRYAFYSLPSGYVGGGPLLILLFDQNGVCTSARWLWSQ